MTMSRRSTYKSDDGYIGRAVYSSYIEREYKPEPYLRYTIKKGKHTKKLNICGRCGNEIDVYRNIRWCAYCRCDVNFGTMTTINRREKGSM